MSPTFLLPLSFAALALAQNWCSYGSNLCGTIGKTPADLRCGTCRSWTYYSNIANGELRMLGLDGGATPTDGNSNHSYMVHASVDSDFDLTVGSNWLLDLLDDSIPIAKDGALWSSQDNGTVFAYGGRVPGDHPVPNSNLLPQLDTSNDSWHADTTAISLYRLTAGASVNVPDLGKGFYIGGYQDQSVATDAPNDGLAHYATNVAVFDTDTQTPSTVDAPFLPSQNGASFYIPVGGGLLVYVGGESLSGSGLTANETTENGLKANKWDHVWIYDIKGDAWFRQPTANAPDPRTEFCGSILYDEASSTWQIWTIGGAAFSTGQVLSTVSVLSIPSFEWYEAAGAATLMSTACENVGPQIFVIGGRNEDTPIGGSDYGAIAYIYDANAQTTATSFTATHTSYTAPSSIIGTKSAAQTPATWAAASLRQLFASASASAAAGAATTGHPNTGSAPVKTQSKVSAGAIAGAVVGAIVVIAILVGLVIFFLRRRRRQTAHELDGRSHIVYEKARIAEVQGEEMRHEVDGAPHRSPPVELA